MGFLVDWQIQNLCYHPEDPDKPLVTPFEPELLNQVSIDVRLGPEILISVPEWGSRSEIYGQRVVIDGKHWCKINLNTYKLGFGIEPGERVLGHTVETFNLPDDIIGFFHLKSSRAREGIGHPIAGLCDPGWNQSVLTLELTNTDPNTYIKLYNNLLIGQMTFFKLDSLPLVSYNKVGHYNGDNTVTASKTNGESDKIWRPKYERNQMS